MNNKLIPFAIVLTVGVILAGSLLVPVLNEQMNNLDEQDNVTYLNEPQSSTYVGGTVKLAPMSGTHEFVWDGTTLTYDDSAVDLTYFASRMSLVAAENMYLIGQNNGWTLTTYGVLDGGSPNANTISATTSGLSAMTLTIDGLDATLEYTVSDTDHTKTITQEWGFIPSSSGKYVGLSTGAISELYYQTEIWGVSNTNGYMVSYNNETGGKVNGQTTTFVNNSTEIASTDIHKAIVGANASEDSIQVNSSSGNPQRLFSYVVPASVSYSSGANDSAIGLISVIPVMVVISLVLMAVAYVVRRND